MSTKRGAACLLYVQKYHDIVSIHIELEIIVKHIFVAQSRIGYDILWYRRLCRGNCRAAVVVVAGVGVGGLM